jgi:hypothetical protein
MSRQLTGPLDLKAPILGAEVGVMDKRCRWWTVGGAVCGQPTYGRGFYYSVAFTSVTPAQRWIPLCERHAADLSDGFIISTAAGGMGIPPID